MVHLTSVNASSDALVITLMCLYGVWYAATRIIFHYHWQRHEFAGRTQKYGWLLLNFTPVGWILYPKLKPWERSREQSAEPGRGQESQLRSKWLGFAMYLGIAWTVVTIVVIVFLRFRAQ
jgi:hypothetical protein